MANYKLVFAPSAEGIETASLDVTDAGSALALAHRHGRNRPVELWHGDKLVCRIAEDSGAGYWRIG